jgi:hypothetical protein
VRLSRILRDYNDAGGVNTLLSLWGFVDGGSFLTKAGHVGIVYSLRGVDVDGLTHAQRRGLTHRMEAALRQLDERTRVYQYLIKRTVDPFVAPICAEPVAQEALTRRTAYLNERRRELYQLAQYVVLLHEPTFHRRTSTRLERFWREPREALRRWLSMQHSLKLLESELEGAIDRLEHKAESFESQLADFVPARLGQADAFRFFRELVNYDASVLSATTSTAPDAYLDYFVADSPVDCHRDHLMVGSQLVKVLSMKEPPGQTFAHILGELLAVPGELIACVEWQRVGQDQMRREIQSRRRHFFNKRVSLVNYVTPEAKGEEMLVDESATATVRQLGDALTEMEVNGHVFGRCSVAVVLHHEDPVSHDDVFLGLIGERAPRVLAALTYGYATLWFTTPYYAASLLMSLMAIVVYRRAPSTRVRPLPPYPHPEQRPTPMLVLGETHNHTTPGPAARPEWLTIPQRGLYTGVMILGAVGTGKTSACMYPYVDQLLRWKADDAARKLGGLVLEVKGDFCGQVRSMLRRTGRESDYVEIGLDTGVCYNPLHNELDPYAVAYAVATLLNNLFGRSKEPFWQQAYTDLLKFVILLRRISDGYTTFSEVYRYILDDQQIDRDIRRLKADLSSPPDVLVIREGDYRAHCIQKPWTHWFADDSDHMAHPYEAGLETFLAAREVAYEVRKPKGAGWAARKHQLEAVERWYLHGWSRLDGRLRSSIVEGVVVFLSLFDDSPAVHRAFCPPRSAYTDDPPAGEPTPLQPIDALIESGKVLALNFPIGMNPGLARILGVMLKLDFQRAVLQRIPQITAQPQRTWRDLLFVCDEYHAFATVGETDPTGDERTFALSRQARLIPIVATQSISSLRSALPGEESWRTLLQCFRTKLFLATSDEFTARNAAELCGRRDRLKAHYSVSESGRDAYISLLTGRPTSGKQSLSASKSYAPHHEYIVSPRTFTQLQNAQAIALPYDGINPLTAQYCYLKPHYLDVQTSYFEHLERGAI